jgi:hypothetical protein
MPLIMLPLWGFLSCTNDKPNETDSPIDTLDTSVIIDTSDTSDTSPPTDPVNYILLDEVATLNRVSMALRGIRPSRADIELIKNDPSKLDDLVQNYANSEYFEQTISDMYAEILLVRDLTLEYPALGDMSNYSRVEIRAALSEEPLEIIKEVVQSDLPFTNIVTADWTIYDETSSKLWLDHTYNSNTGGTQKVYFTDGRPTAGILTSNSMLLKYESNGSNFHRGRANMISDKLLCAPFSERDIPITGDIDLSDEEAVADAVMNLTECVACHQSVDPLASQYFGFRSRLTPFQVITAENNGCDSDLQHQFSCYPIAMYASIGQDNWQNIGLRSPNYWGAHAPDLTAVGHHIASDPRFSLCAATKFSAYLTQTNADDIAFEKIAQLQQVFIDSNYSAKSLAIAIVTDPAFLALDASPSEVANTLPGIQVIRPEQLERLIEDLTGFRLEYELTNNNNGQIRALSDDVIGFRAMSGGVNGSSITSPTHTPTPVKLLVLAAYAEESAGYVVLTDFDLPIAERMLFTELDVEEQDEEIVRMQITRLFERILQVETDPDSTEITAAYELWANFTTPTDTTTAWETLLAALFQSPEVLFY